MILLEVNWLRLNQLLTNTRFVSDQKEIFNKYLQDVISGDDYKMPKFMNRAYSLHKDKIIKLFGSIDIFESEMKDLGYAFTT